MARFPGAVWRPLPENSTQPRITPTQVILHSAVDAPGPSSLWSYFRRSDVTVESHFFVKWDGTVEQYMDTEVRADANRHANARAISIETEDDGNPDATPWSDAQIDAIVRIIRWAHEVHGIPLRLCPAWDQPGIGYHTMFGAPGPWTPVAKTCPGRARIAQMPRIMAALGSNAPATPPAPAPKSSDPRLLRLTSPMMRGQDVRDWQTILVAAGHLGDREVDGIFGPRTEAATKAFQRALKVKADGIVGPATRQAVANLFRYLAAVDKAKAYIKRPTLRRGSRGDHVRHLQRRLGGLKVDGIFGPATEAKVRAFQRSRRLVVDGIVGPKTWAALGW